MDLDDPRWVELEGGYHIPYDPRPALKALENENNLDEVWETLWENLFHQGDVGQASYAAVPHIVRIQVARRRDDWNAYALVASIEDARAERGPDVADWLNAAYQAALARMRVEALASLGRSEEPTLTRSALAVIALGVDECRLQGRLLLGFTSDELADLLKEVDLPI